jgi:hypothetical protein
VTSGRRFRLESSSTLAENSSSNIKMLINYELQIQTDCVVFATSYVVFVAFNRYLVRTSTILRYSWVILLFL